MVLVEVEATETAHTGAAAEGIVELEKKQPASKDDKKAKKPVVRPQVKNLAKTKVVPLRKTLGDGKTILMLIFNSSKRTLSNRSARIPKRQAMECLLPINTLTLNSRSIKLDESI